MSPKSLLKKVDFPEPDGPAIIHAKNRLMSTVTGEGCPLTLTSKTFFYHARNPLLFDFFARASYQLILTEPLLQGRAHV